MSSLMLSRLCLLFAAAVAMGCHPPASAAHHTAAITPVTVQIKPLGDRPTIFINGRPSTPMIYTITDSVGGQWTWEEVPQWNIANFAKAGFHIIQFSLWLNDIWKPDGSLDMDLVQRQFAGALRAAPGATLLLRLHINAPFWWNEAHPDETVAYADTDAHPHKQPWGLQRNTTDADDLNAGKVHSLASVRWRQETTSVLQRFFKELAAMPQGNALGFVNVCDGVSHEWHNWSFISHDPDTSAPMTAYFRGWLQNKYRTDAALQAAWADPSVTFASARVPGSAARNQTSDGVFRDPQKERYVMDYFEAQHSVVADDVIYFDGLVKKLWPRPIAVGNFYGYYFMTFSRQTTGGHLAVDRVLRSPDVDFLAAPQSYYGPAHAMGGSGQSRAVSESALLHGKLVLDEMDQATSMRHPFDEPTPEQRADDVAIIRRNTLGPLVRGMGMWFYDFGPNQQTGWWAHPDYTRQAHTLKRLFDDRVSKPLAPQADVLMVWDVATYYHVAAKWTPVSETALDAVSNAVHKSGSMTDDVFMDDLPLVPLDRYKVVVFANGWRLTPEHRALIKTRVAAQGRHVVFSYAAGYSDGERNDMQLISDITGIHIEPGAARGNATIKVTQEAFGETYGIPHKTPLSPFPIVKDGQATTLGTLADTGEVGFVKKARPDSGATWFSTLPITNSRTWRALFQQAGAHVYENTDDVLASGNGVLWVHSGAGGTRDITLRNGKVIHATLPPRSTAAWDNVTGAELVPASL
ncbi:MAG: hypothetical protein SF187_15625 [Deltaproteobacteria bacterium]|nr:hypothetical protein [Deltaproteobacteria bacterium]